MEKEIRKVIDTFLTYWSQHDPEKMASLWMKDGDLINPWGQWGKGIEGVLRIFKLEQTGILRKSTLENEILWIRPIDAKTAWVEGIARLEGGVDKNGNELPLFEHHFVYLFVKDMDGKWKFSSARPYALLGPLKDI
jgi:uncharacterized protein (TIGR02246 family)